MRVAAGSVGLSTPEVNVRLPGALTVRPASEPFLLLLQIGRSLANEGEIGFYGKEAANCGAVRAAANSTDYLGYVQQHALLCHCVNMCL